MPIKPRLNTLLRLHQRCRCSNPTFSFLLTTRLSIFWTSRSIHDRSTPVSPNKATATTDSVGEESEKKAIRRYTRRLLLLKPGWTSDDAIRKTILSRIVRGCLKTDEPQMLYFEFKSRTTSNTEGLYSQHNQIKLVERESMSTDIEESDDGVGAQRRIGRTRAGKGIRIVDNIEFFTKELAARWAEREFTEVAWRAALEWKGNDNNALSLPSHREAVASDAEFNLPFITEALERRDTQQETTPPPAPQWTELEIALYRNQRWNVKLSDRRSEADEALQKLLGWEFVDERLGWSRHLFQFDAYRVMTNEQKQALLSLSFAEAMPAEIQQTRGFFKDGGPTRPLLYLEARSDIMSRYEKFLTAAFREYHPKKVARHAVSFDFFRSYGLPEPTGGIKEVPAGDLPAFLGELAKYNVQRRLMSAAWKNGGGEGEMPTVGASRLGMEGEEEEEEVGSPSKPDTTRDKEAGSASSESDTIREEDVGLTEVHEAPQVLVR